MSMLSTKPIEVLYCCSDSDRDEQLRRELEKHLKILEWEGVITSWHPGLIGAGMEYKREIEMRLQTADIILPLISSDFIASDFNWNFVVQQAKARNRDRTARVVPILLRRVDNWKVAFGNIKVLPEGEKPVTDWKPYDNAFDNISKGIRKVVEEIHVSRSPIQNSLLYISASVKPVANAFGTVASTIVSFTSAVLSSPPKISRSRQQKRAGLMPLMMNPVVIVFGVLFLVPQLPNLLGSSLLQTKHNQTMKSTHNVNSTGWIWIGVTNNSSGSLHVGERLLKPSNTDLFPSIEPSVIPLPKAVVTVKYKVNLKKDKSLTEQLVELQPGEKLVILKVETKAKPSQNSPYTQVRAQVRKCNKSCDK